VAVAVGELASAATQSVVTVHGAGDIQFVGFTTNGKKSVWPALDGSLHWEQLAEPAAPYVPVAHAVHTAASVARATSP